VTFCRKKGGKNKPLEDSGRSPNSIHPLLLAEEKNERPIFSSKKEKGTPLRPPGAGSRISMICREKGGKKTPMQKGKKRRCRAIRMSTVVQIDLALRREKEECIMRFLEEGGSSPKTSKLSKLQRQMRKEKERIQGPAITLMFFGGGKEEKKRGNTVPALGDRDVLGETLYFTTREKREGLPSSRGRRMGAHRSEVRRAPCAIPSPGGGKRRKKLTIASRFILGGGEKKGGGETRGATVVQVKVHAANTHRRLDERRKKGDVHGHEKGGERRIVCSCSQIRRTGHRRGKKIV